MKRPTLNARFYETYHFASVVSDILVNQIDHLDVVNNFCCDGKHLHYSLPFPRFSAFHGFLHFIIDDIIVEATKDIDLDERRQIAAQIKSIKGALADLRPHVLPIEEAFQYHGFQHESFISWLKSQGKKFAHADENDVYEYLNELRLSGPLEELVTQSAREVFFVLFGNRKLLLHFNHMMAQAFKLRANDEIEAEYRRHFKKPAVLKRVQIPEWTKRAVFYRDRGRCVACDVDLSGLISTWPDDHFDHMVALASGGLNDVTNIQLLCGRCNRKKGSRGIITSNVYEDWYPFPTN